MTFAVAMFGAFLVGRFCRWRDRPDRLVVELFSDSETAARSALKRQLKHSLLNRN